MVNRIGTKYQYDALTSQILMSHSKMVRAQDALLTGKKPDLAINDPTGASILIKTKAIRGAVEQYNTNLRTATDYLKSSESALSDVNDVLKSAYTLALQGANSTTGQDARNTMVQQVDQLQKRLLELANTQGASGQYLFAGQTNDAKPFTVAGTVVTYHGDANSINVETAANETLTVNTQGQTLFTNAYNALQSLKDNLTSGNIALLSGTDVPALQGSMDSVQLQRGIIGGKLQEVNTYSTRNQRRMDEFDTKASDIEDVDMAQAITDFQLAQTAYQAVLTSTSLTTKLSLMDFIR
ncbi:MAG: flagellar hook-associated protein FlgL [Armatimonadetes bacterium]|nr:flagellar hook-associated protein FlgL [Armatimonadota bacterium]